MIALAEHMDGAAARHEMDARRRNRKPWERIVAESGYSIPSPTDTNTVPVVVDERRLGFIITESDGMRVLHTERVAFFDVDLGAGEKASTVLQKLHRFVAMNPEYGFRVYRTAAGLRYLCTTHLFTPAGEDVQALMQKLGVDPRYSAMCSAAQFFGARLNPKPKRRKGAGEYAATAYQFTTGSPLVLLECLSILKLHDEETGAFSELPLA